MFGTNSVQSSWANPQQNQQQQPSAFGQPSTFGSGGAFGQNQPPQQANPMFGGLGGAPNTTTTAPTPGFGAFGSSTNQTNPMFGSAKPATGFGAFGGGGNTTFGSGAFGSTSNTAGTPGTSTGLFGQPANNTSSTSTFGGGGGLFGNANKPATGFGLTSTDSVPAPVTTGTSNPPYSVFSEKDPTSNANTTLQYQSITAMPQYRGSSFEELRVQDYQQGRKTSGGFGQSATFGTAQPTGGIFGAPAQQNPSQPANPLFGGNAFNTGNTNQPATGGAFGSGGVFGQNPSNQGSTLFGGGASTFGQPQQQQQQSAFGTFGQPQQNQQQPATGGGIFGGGGAFGQPTKSTFGGGTGTFGSGTNAFGQPQQQQQTGGLFGQSQQSGSTFSAGFGNGSKPSVFGQPAQPTTQPTTFGGFGGQQQQNQQGQQNQQQPSGGLFGGGLFGQGNNQQQQGQQPNQSGGLFGANQANQPPSGGLFGNSTGGSLFGNNNNQQQQQQNQQPAQPGGFGSGGLFGQSNNSGQASGGGLFGGSKPAAPTSLFGNNANNQQPSTSGFGAGGLFGNKPNASGMGGSQPTQQGGGFGSSFGNATTLNASTANPAAQGTLTASISQPIAPNLPIYSMLPPGPRFDADQGTKKKPPFFVDVPTRSPMNSLGLGYSVRGTKPRGFGKSSTSTITMGRGGPIVTGSLFEGAPDVLLLNKPSDKNAPGSDSLLGRSGSPALGSGARSSVKKLILDKPIDSDLFSKSTSSKVTFNPALSQAAREQGSSSLHTSQSPTRTPIRPIVDNPNQGPDSAAPATSSPAKEGSLREGDYWVKPDLQTLIHSGHDKLLAFKDLIVGREGYGEVHFLEPVDLTGLPKLSALFGQVVRFDDKEVAVYPDSDDVDKPPAGTGLNVRARIILLRAWATDKATREPIKDEKHPAAVRHLKRLSKMKDTHFESFDIKEGKWTFTVDHF